MPRQSRKLSESKIYHVMVRGNERKVIFHSEQDKAKFIEILFAKSEDEQASIYAYCLMDNHVHLLLNKGKNTISRLMKRINVSYVYYFNKKYDRVGHLFQDRFKSEAIENEKYLLAAVRYIHNNPIKAKLATQLHEYKWSSYNEYINRKTNPIGIEKEFILNMFSTNRDEAVKIFLDFSTQESAGMFIEYQEDHSKNKIIHSEEEARQFMMKYLQERKRNISGTSNEKATFNLRVRNALISELKNKSNLTISEIADLMKIGKNIVQRVK